MYLKPQAYSLCFFQAILENGVSFYKQWYALGGGRKRASRRNVRHNTTDSAKHVDRRRQKRRSRSQKRSDVMENKEKGNEGIIDHFHTP